MTICCDERRVLVERAKEEVEHDGAEERKMAGTVWSKFFWADWLSDPGLRACPATARGIWMDMLCVAAAHDPPGYVAVKNRALTVRDISRLTGEEIPAVEQALKELEGQNVFGRTRQGVIYSRRMIRDSKKTEKMAQRAGVAKGGNPTLVHGATAKSTKSRKKNTTYCNAVSLRKQNETSAEVNPLPGACARGLPIANSHKPESISQKKKKGGSENEPPLRARARERFVRSDPLLDSDWPSDYREQFEQAYPHKVSMAAALKILDEARNSGKVSWRGLLAGLACYVETNPTDRYWMNPKRWLKQERWNDKPARTNGKQERRHVADELADEARRLEGLGNGPAVSVGGSEIGGDDAQVVSRDKPS
jgi:hypothetical protein